MSFTYKSIRAEKERTGCHADDIFFLQIIIQCKKEKEKSSKKPSLDKDVSK